jgi:rhodanese-related sulfurtransferase
MSSADPPRVAAEAPGYAAPVPRKTADHLLEEARGRLRRVHPAAAHQAALTGARMIDIRSQDQMIRDGLIPEALVIPRNVLEWRLDPSGAYRHPFAPSPEEWTIVVCDEGYQSSLVAAALQDMGFRHATDLIGGFQAWRAAELPVIACEEEHLAAVADMEAYITGATARA